MIKSVKPEQYDYNSTYAEEYWDAHSMYVQPYDFSEVAYRSFPSSCESYGLFSPSFGNHGLESSKSSKHV